MCHSQDMQEAGVRLQPYSIAGVRKLAFAARPPAIGLLFLRDKMVATAYYWYSQVLSTQR